MAYTRKELLSNDECGEKESELKHRKRAVKKENCIKKKIELKR